MNLNDEKKDASDAQRPTFAHLTPEQFKAMKQAQISRLMEWEKHVSHQ